jgi:hypothetical protein
LLLALLPALSWAGPWDARGPQGLVVRIEQDVYRTRDGYVLTRRYPDGSVDAQFGEQGSTVFSLGPDNEGPASLRTDALGRLWVAGGSLGAGDQLQAVVLRFGPLGKPDRAYARDGRSAVQPSGRAARALDLLPLPDGSSYVAGIVTDSSGQERSGWWRLLPDGTVDRTFGLGGLWADSGRESSEVLGLATTADGSVTLRLRRGTAADAPVESWTLAPQARLPVLAGTLAAPVAAAPTAPAGSGPQPASFRQGSDPFAPTAGGPSAAAPTSAAAAAAAASAPAAAAAASTSDLWGPLGLALLLFLLLVVLPGLCWAWWRRRR